ncbi:hypothetical protein SAY86_013369 [Trapa natans]|uniref:RING-type E3 ubiquitin transferase n=1 Tax=Trapa natans TaxID=22666 RepID=A0AAN7LYJ2_TRANT|nr:hypothetical protein SAY86_013369 [Trapa natans]
MPPSSPPRPVASIADAVDASPLLGHSVADNLLRSRRFLRQPVPPLGGTAARLLRRASGRRMSLREPSMQVRENAAEQLENRQSDWAYSKPIVVLDILWNLVLVGAAFSILVLSADEIPDVPLRLWIVGYVFQCVFHMACVIVEYTRRQREMEYEGLERNRGWGSGDLNPYSNSNSVSGSEEGDSEDYTTETNQHHDDEETSVTKHLESANTMFSFVWWIIGFYWVDAGGQDLGQGAPQLYWLCITFLILDVVFVVICVAVACLIGVAVCFCLPCIIAILYALTDQEGATQEDIDRLAKYKFRMLGDYEKENGEVQPSFGGVMIECGTDTPTERALSQDDAECCICLSVYEDGSELRELPCRHHFHCACIDKWLGINAICPLCKYNILKPHNESSSETV